MTPSLVHGDVTGHVTSHTRMLRIYCSIVIENNGTIEQRDYECLPLVFV